MKVLPQELQTARYSLTRTHAYVSSLLLSLNFIEQPGLGTFGVDKHWRCYYDPEILAKWTPAQIKGALFHECNHILRDHHARGDFFENKLKYNICGDLEINPDVLESGLELPPGVAFPKQLKVPEDKLAEEYYHLLKDPPPQNGNGSGKGEGEFGNGKCGSCAGNPNEGEEGDPAQGDGISNAEKELIKRQVAKDIEQAARQQGNVPGGLKRWAEATLHPQVKWTKELAAVCRRAMIEVMGKQDRTFKRPSRIASCLGGRLVLPGWKSYIPNVAMVFDTSGSMGKSDLAKAISEGKGVLQAIGGGGFNVTSISVDCAVGSKKKVASVRDISLDGGGGTDMRLGFQEADTIKPPVDILIVFTDGYTPWPAEAPNYKTIIVLTQAGAEKEVPAWAKCIVVN